MYSVCKHLVRELANATPEEKLQELLDDHNAKVTTPSAKLTLPKFRARIMPSIIVNKLLCSEYSYLFENLTNQEIAKLLHVTPKNLNLHLTSAIRKLAAIRLKPYESKNLTDAFLSMEAVYYTSKEEVDLERLGDEA